MAIWLRALDRKSISPRISRCLAINRYFRIEAALERILIPSRRARSWRAAKR